MAEAGAAKSIFDFSVTDQNGNIVTLDRYKESACLIVNFSTKDETFKKLLALLTPLHRKYSNGARKDLHILLFPCFQFGAHETPAEVVRSFIDGASATATSPDNALIGEIFAEIEVNGSKAPTLYQFLKRKKPGNCGGFINSNFTMFLVDRNGVPTERFGPNIHPYVLEDMVDQLLVCR